MHLVNGGRSADERAADVRRVLEAGRRVRGHEELLKSALAKSTRLSLDGVHLALTDHLEVDATDEEVAKLVAAAGDAERVAVILSSTVFVGALRAVALARAAAAEVVVRPSSHEPIFAKALVHELRELGDLGVSVVDDLDVATVTRGEVHVYGSDETIATLRARASIPVRGHGTGLGVAFVVMDELEVAAADVARDVVPFDQRGCLSPRLVLVLGDEARAAAFGKALAAELATFRANVPRGELTDDERADAARYRGTVAFAGELFDGPDFAVGVSDEVLLPPPGRHVHVTPVHTEEAIRRALEPLARFVAAVGVNTQVPVLEDLVPKARRSRLGLMQKPPLDGPVDLR